MRFADGWASGFASVWLAGDDFVQADPHKMRAASNAAVNLDVAVQHARSVEFDFGDGAAFGGDEQMGRSIDRQDIRMDAGSLSVSGREGCVSRGVSGPPGFDCREFKLFIGLKIMHF